MDPPLEEAVLSPLTLALISILSLQPALRLPRVTLE